MKKIIIKEPFASEIRNKLIRFRKGNLTESEFKQIEKDKKILKQYKAKWVD